MRKLTIIGAILISAGLLIYSCSDEFLDVPAQAALNEQSLGSVDGVNATLLSAYAMLDGWNGNTAQNPWGGQQSNYLWGDIMSDDAYKGSEPSDFPDWEVLEKLSWTATHPEFNNKFLADYEGIARANAAIQLALNTEALPEADRTTIIGEARFLRAHFHFDLYKMFGYIPYYTEEDEDFKKPNTDEAGNLVSPISQIISDFATAATELPAEQGQVGRVNRYTALAYLGKAYVYNEQWAEAKTALDEVVDEGPYELQDCYHSVFSVEGNNGANDQRESILAFQASVNDGASSGENGGHLERLTFAHGGSPFGCCGVRQPSQNLVNAYKVDANGLPLFDTFNDTELNAADPVDPRLDWIVARVGVPVLNYSADEDNDGENDWAYSTGWVRAASYGGPYSNKKNMYHFSSGESQTAGSWVNTHLSAMNIHLLRYAEVLLLLAEAEANLTNLPRAMELVNMVRDRAGNCAQGPTDVLSVDIDDPSITWATYDVGLYTTFPNQEYALQAIQWERRLELALEGHRFFDLRRWGIAEEVMNEYLAVEQNRRDYLEGYLQYDTDRHRWYPLPQQQIDLSRTGGEARLKQVPGFQ